MDLRPTPNSEVCLYKGVPFSIDYKNIMDFENKGQQTEYFNSLEKRVYNSLSYVRGMQGTIKVSGVKEELIQYNYMSFKNELYGDKVFYAFIVGVAYVNPKTTLVRFVIDDWQTYCFDITFRESFIERKHCKRWNADGTPVINTQPENLELGRQYVVKAQERNESNIYWVCFVSSYQVASTSDEGVPNPMTLFYAPIYRTDTYNEGSWTFNGTPMTSASTLLHSAFPYDDLVNTLESGYIIENPPFHFNVSSIGSSGISITSEDSRVVTSQIGSKNWQVLRYNGTYKEPDVKVNDYPKYDYFLDSIKYNDNDKGESKLLMYPYSFVQLVDGQGNTFDIELEYLYDNRIQISTFTSAGNNSKQAHIVKFYRDKRKNINLTDKWELQNSIINSSPNQLTIIDSYSAAYLQGNRNQIEQNIANVQAQASLNNQIAQNTATANIQAGAVNSIGQAIAGAGIGISGGANDRGLVNATSSLGAGLINAEMQYLANDIIGQNNIRNTALQGALSSEKAINNALAKYNDAQNVPPTVALQGGDVFFTFQNGFQGYSLVYKQISDEYIKVISDYFRKYGYAYNQIEKPNLRTRQNWNYIRTIDANIIGNINDTSLENIKEIFNNGVTIWHTSDVGNYSLANNEI